MQTTVTTSIDSILSRVYALSALHVYRHSNSEAIPLLTPDQRPALATLVADAFVETVMRFMPHVTDCELPYGDEDDIASVTFECAEGGGAMIPAFRRLVENAAVFEALAAIFAEENEALAADFRDKARTTADNIKLLLETREGWPRIVPSY